MQSKIIEHISKICNIPSIQHIENKKIHHDGFYLLFSLEVLEFIIVSKIKVKCFLKFPENTSNKMIFEKFIEIIKHLPDHCLKDYEKLCFSFEESL